MSGEIAWYQKPVAMLGAAAIAYHECLRGRRTSVCRECGRLNHASADRCLCGGVTDESEHPEETLDDWDGEPGEDVLAGWPFAAAKWVLLTGGLFAAAELLHIAVDHGRHDAAAGAVVLFTLAMVVWR